MIEFIEFREVDELGEAAEQAVGLEIVWTPTLRDEDAR